MGKLSCKFYFNKLNNKLSLLHISLFLNMSGFNIEELKELEEKKNIFGASEFEKLKKLINNINYEKNQKFFDASNRFSSVFMEILNNNGINSKEQLYENYSSVQKIIIKFINSFHQFLINEKIINNNDELPNNESENNESENKILLSEPLSKETKFNSKDILFSRLIYLCILLFNHLWYHFKLDKDLSSEILLMTYKNINKEIQSLSPNTNDFFEMNVKFNFGNEEIIFCLSNNNHVVTIGNHKDNMLVIREEFRSSRFHAILMVYFNNLGVVSIALIDNGSLRGIKEKYPDGTFSSRENVYYLKEKKTLRLGDFELTISF